jgi:hypothetical protein
MDSVQMGFRDRVFDLTICIQNGICAFAVDQQELFREAMWVTRSGGRVMFSSYTPQFWEHRLEWFEIQSAHRLIGEIDYQATGNGTIVCKDGFHGTTANRQSFEGLAASLEVTPRITEVDGSSLFWSSLFLEHCSLPAVASLRTNRRRPPRRLLCRSQHDQGYADGTKYSRSDQQVLAFVRKVDCHDRHDSGMSNIQPRGESNHAAIRRRITRCQQQENPHCDIETKPHRLGVFLIG